MLTVQIIVKDIGTWISWDSVETRHKGHRQQSVYVQCMGRPAIAGRAGRRSDLKQQGYRGVLGVPRQQSHCRSGMANLSSVGAIP